MKTRHAELGIKSYRSRAQVWDLMFNVENYPKYIKHLYAMKLHGPMEVGSKWSDWTTILFFPLPITHTNTIIEEEKTLEFKFDFPIVGGWMKQRFDMFPGTDPVEAKFAIDFEFTNPLVGSFLGPILEKRWLSVMKEAGRRLQEEDRKNGLKTI